MEKGPLDGGSISVALLLASVHESTLLHRKALTRGLEVLDGVAIGIVLKLTVCLLQAGQGSLAFGVIPFSPG